MKKVTGSYIVKLLTYEDTVEEGTVQFSAADSAPPTQRRRFSTADSAPANSATADSAPADSAPADSAPADSAPANSSDGRFSASLNDFDFKKI
ncbi:Hypothetical protein FKW44_017018 [Caligus rogercresseyi]|uniref:Uncharacterized protein n=1 Tax=Caligus rogercresseyi TaxID=217165 RepID=A0A7T8H2T6_CALRO|nr:Hypothetical protein FKW44_017018 [Caligus rogercresseyi]